MNTFEVVIIVGIILLQLNLGYRLLMKIAQYTAIFDKEDLPHISQKIISKEIFEEGNVSKILSYKHDEDDEAETISITYIKDNVNKKLLTKLCKFMPGITTKNSDIMSIIVKYINVYLIKNKGASMDFHLIKDIVDKHTENLETQIENRIPAPLYLGLAATMIGIIIGLFSVNFGGDGTDAMDAIQPLIDGVKLAMVGSVMGLIITTIFSIKIYKDALTETGNEKSEFLSKLQSELMPRMGKGKMPEVSILSDKLDVFARTTTNTVAKLDNIVKTSSKTVNEEKQLIAEIRKLDVAKITTANVEVFNNLEEMMDSFQNFAKYYEELDKSMLNTSLLLSNLQQFVNSTEDINNILAEVKSTIKQGSEASDFFNQHIKSFEKYSDAVNEAVANNDSSFKEVIGQLTKATSTQFESFNKVIAEYDLKLTEAFTNSVTKFTETMDKQVRRTEEAFEKRRPKFEKLDKLDKLENLDKLKGIDERLSKLDKLEGIDERLSKLDKLESIDERLSSLEEKLSKTINKGDRDVIYAIDRLNSSVKKSNVVTNVSGESSSQNIVIEQPKKSIFNYLETIIKIGAYIVIISYGVHTLLMFLNIV